MVTNQTAELRDPTDFANAEEIAAEVLEKSPGLIAAVHGSPADWHGKPFASIVFSIDYGLCRVDWRRHQKVVQIALDVAGVAHRFKTLR